MSTLELDGLDGTNLVGFLAALGTLRTLDAARPDWRPRLRWREAHSWLAVLECDAAVGIPDIVEALVDGLAVDARAPVLHAKPDVKFDAATWRALAADALESDASPTAAEWLAALATDAALDDDGNAVDLGFRTMSGAGHQHQLKTMCDLQDAVGPEHLTEALRGPWTYTDRKLTLRLDPSDDRRYAYRARNPSDSSQTITTVWGANRLAAAGMACFPTFGVRNGVAQTTGFRGRRASDTYVTWPLWSPAVELQVVLSLLAHPLLVAESVPRTALSAMGVTEVMRAQRINVDKYRNFAPAQPAPGASPASE